nr:MAG TPA: nuclease-like protein [Caudoviricetes sp.]
MRMKILTLILFLPLSIFAFSAKVIKISDGDTITVLSGKEQTKVRLYGIDAPEKKQDYNQKT